MANSHKNIVITPNVGSASAYPAISFTGADAVNSGTITLSVYNTGTTATISFSGLSGQLFSISDTMLGTIFSANDVSGIPSIEVLDSGLVKLAQYNGQVVISTATAISNAKLTVQGNAYINGIITATTYYGTFAGTISSGVSAGSVANALTIGTGLSGTAGTYNGSAAVTVSLNTATLMANAVTAGTAASASVSAQVNAVAQPANATYYPAFVNLNNASAGAVSVYTTSSLTINPSNGTVSIAGYNVRTAATLDLTALNTGTFYPVTIPVDVTRTATRMRVQVGLNSGSVPGWSTHPQGFTVMCDWSVNGSGYGTTPVSRVIHNYAESWTNQTIVGGITQMIYSSTEVIYLRGGGKYFFESDGSANTVPTVQTGTYTSIGQTVTNTTTVVNSVWSSAYSQGTISGVGFGNVYVTGALSVGTTPSYGTSGQLLQSNGSSAPSWVNASTITAGSASLTSTYVGFGSGSNTLTGSANLTWSGSALSVTGSISSTAGIFNQAAAGNMVIQNYTNGGSNGLGMWAGGNQVIFSTGQLLFAPGATLASGSWPSAYTNSIAMGAGGYLVLNGTSQTSGAILTVNGGSYLNGTTTSTGQVSAPSVLVPNVAQIGPNGSYGVALLYAGNTFAGQIYGQANGLQFTNNAGGNTLFITNAGGISFSTTSSYGTSGQILQSNGNAPPTWVNATGVAAGTATTATNLAGGTAGQLAYQSAPGVTAFAGPGTAGQLLVSAGASAPVYTNTASIYVNRATIADTSTNSAVAYSLIASHSAGTGLTGTAFNGSANQTWSLNTSTLMQTAVTALSASGSAGSVANALTIGTGLSGTAGTYNGSAAVTVSLNTSTLMNLSLNVAGGAAGSLVYQSGPNATTSLAIGTNGYVLTSSGTAPQWTAASSISNPTPQSVTFNNSGAGGASGTAFNGSVAQTISYNTLGASPLAGSISLTILGTVAVGKWNAGVITVSYGGTGLSSLTANYIPYGNGTSAYQSSANLTFNGTTLSTLGGTASAYALQATGGSTGGTAGNQMLLAQFSSNNGNGNYLQITDTRTTTGADWTTAATRIQEKIDATWMGFMEFNGSANNGGISFGVGLSTVSPTSVPYAMYITSAGGIAFGTSSANYGTAGQILQSNGNAAPTWVNASGLGAGSVANALTIGTGLSGTVGTYNGSAAVTVSLNTATLMAYAVNHLGGYVNATTGVFSGVTTVTNNTAVTSVATGALQVTGGVGVGGGVYVGGIVTATNVFVGPWPVSTSTNVAQAFQPVVDTFTSAGTTTTFTLSTTPTNIGYTTVVVDGTSQLKNGSAYIVSGNKIVFSEIPTSGSVVDVTTISVVNGNYNFVNGPAGSNGQLQYNNSGGLAATTYASYNPSTNVFSLTSTTSVSSANSGALQVTGGVGIGGGVFVGGVITATNVFVGPWAVSTGTSAVFNTSTLIAYAVTATNAGTAYATIGTHTAGTGLTGSTFNGSAPVTWSLNTATLMASAVTALSTVLTQNYIGYGNSSNILTGSSVLQFNGTNLSVNQTVAGNSILLQLQNSGNGSNLTIDSATSAGSYLPNAVAGDVIIRTEANSLGLGGTVGLKFGTPSVSFGTWNNSAGLSVLNTATFSGGVGVGNLTLNGAAPQVSLTNGTANYISFNTNGVSAPTFNASSTGTKILLYPNASSIAADFAIGISSSTLWTGVPNSGQQFQWFAGTSTIATLSGTGTFAVVGDIIGFSSDKRLKTDIRPISSATSKVMSLTGIVYKWNNLANGLAGYNTHEDMVGLFAQDVQAVLPEAVKPAPFDTEQGVSKSGENYLTVQYEKVVPLLVEAIKEQQAQIEELRAQIKELKNSK